MFHFERTDEGELILSLTPVVRDLGDEVDSASGLQPEAVTYYFDDFRDTDILALSPEYIARLKALVAQAEMEFS